MSPIDLASEKSEQYAPLRDRMRDIAARSLSAGYAAIPMADSHVDAQLTAIIASCGAAGLGP